MSCFVDDAEETRILHALKAYIEEWGVENVRICLPESWERHSTSEIKGVKVWCNTLKSVQILAVVDSRVQARCVAEIKDSAL